MTATTAPVRHPGELRWETRLLAVVTAVLVVFGVVCTYSASSLVPDASGDVTGWEFALRQLSGAVLGGVLMVVLSRLDYHLWRRAAWPLLLLTVVMLVIPVLPFTHAIAPVRNGARRWIQMPGIQFQPSELARLAIVVWCAMLAAKKGDQIRQLKKGVLPFVTIIGLVSLLILIEPNLSMAVLVALLGGIVLFVAGARIGHFLVLGFAAVVLVLDQINRAGYRMARVHQLLHGDAPTGSTGLTQVDQSVIGFGSGGVFGTGLGKGQFKLGHLPYAYSDFLFSTIGEEWGFIGVVMVIFLFVLFCWLGFRIARTASDAFGQYLAAGLTAAVGVTAFFHMAVTLKLMPATGLTLPFMSYGRSSLVITLVSVGILLSIGRMRGKPARGAKGEG